jgi:NAD(P)-dependent dehydrogenase (short-subunit alcohol dehydrogenase family)
VVNNACLAIFGSFETVSMDEIRKVYDVNVFGVLNVIHSVLPSMLESNRGIIHNVSSGVAITGFQDLLGYASSKAAVETLTKCLSLEYRNTHITFNIIHPPLTNTPSARPIGLPENMLEAPEKVGYALAKRIFSKKKVIAPFWKSGLGIRLMKIFPYFMGNLFSKLTYKNKD